MKNVLPTVLLLLLCNSCFSQDSSGIMSTSKDTIQLYKPGKDFLSAPLFVAHEPLYKLGNDYYYTNELKPFLLSHKKASVAFKSYQLNNITGYLFTGMSFFATWSVFSALDQHRNMFPPIGTTVGCLLLRELFFAKARKKLSRAITLYNRY